MKPLSILNDVLGPVMRGPSSSHTAASYRFGRLARSLLGEEPSWVRITFDAGGSYGRVYKQQSADLALAAGLMGWDITDERFVEALDWAFRAGLHLEFVVEPLPGADHPNTVQLELASTRGRSLELIARSVGGGMIEITRLNGWPVLLQGDRYEFLLEVEEDEEKAVSPFIDQLKSEGQEIKKLKKAHSVLFHGRSFQPAKTEIENKLRRFRGLRIFEAEPLMFVVPGKPIFRSAAEILELAERRRTSLGRLALNYEAELLQLDEDVILEEMNRRLEVMKNSIIAGMKEDLPLQLLRPSAGRLLQAEAKGRVAAGGMLTRAAARAMAAQHTAAGMGVICAAPTAGSAGTIPGIISTLLEDKKISEKKALEALLAAGAIGLIVGYRATFAAEVAGCQVEIGAASAMGAAAVVEAAGGEARQAVDAAAISFQNTMGSVCDLVKGICEIPCHTRNAVAAASAFICADLILGGYENPIPLDETIDAVYEVGRMLPPELKVTALGGLACCPSAQSLKKNNSQ